jgi:hypothetical protein
MMHCTPDPATRLQSGLKLIGEHYSRLQLGSVRRFAKAKLEQECRRARRA